MCRTGGCTIDNFSEHTNPIFMDALILKEIRYAGVTLQVPDEWRHKTEEFRDEDGTKSYGIAVSSRGRTPRSVNLSWGVMPEGTNAYTEACITYEQVVGEIELAENEEAIMSFAFQEYEAHGFNAHAENGLPCFFFCVEIPSGENKILLTALASAANIPDLEDLLDFVESHISVQG